MNFVIFVFLSRRPAGQCLHVWLWLKRIVGCGCCVVYCRCLEGVVGAGRSCEFRSRASRAYKATHVRDCPQLNTLSAAHDQDGGVLEQCMRCQHLPPFQLPSRINLFDSGLANDHSSTPSSFIAEAVICMTLFPPQNCGQLGKLDMGPAFKGIRRLCRIPGVVWNSRRSDILNLKRFDEVDYHLCRGR